jgi:hypothetical protein
MSSLEKLKGDHIQSRQINVKSYDAGAGRVLVVGTLSDDRSVHVYTEDGRSIPPGQVHGMTLRLLVGGAPPKILDAEAEMSRFPREQCTETASSVKKLIGLNMAKGFSKEVSKRIGGTKGCLHLFKLALAMATPALHGWANNKRRYKDQVKRGSSFTLERVKNSCWVWREEGEVYQEVSQKTKELSDGVTGGK